MASISTIFPFVTRLSDRSDPVPDETWDEAARRYDEPALAALVLWIATSNLYNVTTRQSRPPVPPSAYREQ